MEKEQQQGWDGFYGENGQVRGVVESTKLDGLDINYHLQVNEGFHNMIGRLQDVNITGIGESSGDTFGMRSAIEAFSETSQYAAVRSQDKNVNMDAFSIAQEARNSGRFDNGKVNSGVNTMKTLCDAALNTEKKVPAANSAAGRAVLENYVETIIGSEDERRTSPLPLDAIGGHIARSLASAAEGDHYSRINIDVLKNNADKIGASLEGGGLNNLNMYQSQVFPLLGLVVLATDVRTPQLGAIDVANPAGNPGHIDFRYDIDHIYDSLSSTVPYIYPRDTRDGQMPRLVTTGLEPRFDGDTATGLSGTNYHGVLRKTVGGVARHFIQLDKNLDIYGITVGTSERLRTSPDPGTFEITGILLKGDTDNPEDGRYYPLMSSAMDMTTQPDERILLQRNLKITDNAGTVVGYRDINIHLDFNNGGIKASVKSPSNRLDSKPSNDCDDWIIGLEFRIRKHNTANDMDAVRMNKTINNFNLVCQEVSPLGHTVIARFGEYVADGSTGQTAESHIKSHVDGLSKIYSIVIDRDIQEKMDAAIDLSIPEDRMQKWAFEEYLGSYNAMIDHNAGQIPTTASLALQDPYFIADQALIEDLNFHLSESLHNTQIPGGEKGTWTIILSEDISKLLLQKSQFLQLEGSQSDRHVIDPAIRYGIDTTYTMRATTIGSRQVSIIIVSENRYRFIPQSTAEFFKDKDTNRFVKNDAGEIKRRPISIYYKSNDPQVPIAIFYPRSMAQHIAIDPENRNTFGVFLSYRQLFQVLTSVQLRVNISNYHERYRKVLKTP